LTRTVLKLNIHTIGIHFNDNYFHFRPDLIDISRTRHSTNRQNLELAFSTAEQELGVTRLLDPEG